MLDRDRILAKLDELDGYGRELCQIVPQTIEEYLRKVEKRRATERLLQISVECILDVCHLFVSGLRLGLPAQEDDLVGRMDAAGLISPDLAGLLRKMRRFRNILVHEYGEVDDHIVFETARERLNDLVRFRGEILKALETVGG
jgi:uncharacterized protein YutE (UPF0331/DUF86 family)